MFGPLDARRHDITLFRRSGIKAHISDALFIYGRQFCIYGNPAYVLPAYLQIGFGGGNVTPPKSAFNKVTAQVRISFEWAFKDIKRYFTYADFARKMIVVNVFVEKWYMVGALLWNVTTCPYGSQ